MSSSVALKISANSVHRAKWNLKLGFCSEAWPFPISLNSVSGQGGFISRTKAFVLRVYPLVYITKETVDESTKKSVRSSKMEKRYQQMEDKKRLEMAERFFNEANIEVEKEEQARRKSMRLSSKNVKDIENGEDLYKLMELSVDAESFEADLTMTQKQLLHECQMRKNDERMEKVQSIASERLKNWKNEAKSTPMLKVTFLVMQSYLHTSQFVLVLYCVV